MAPCKQSLLICAAPCRRRCIGCFPRRWTMNDGEEEVRFEPSAAFLAEVEKQAKPAALEAVYRYAAARVPMVASAGGRSDSVYAEELVQDALGDTVIGALRWDPAERSLA